LKNNSGIIKDNNKNDNDINDNDKNDNDKNDNVKNNNYKDKDKDIDNHNDNQIPLHVKKYLDIQENILTKKILKENYTDNLINRLAKRSNKKVEDLLIKKIDYIKIKNELNDLKKITSPPTGEIPPYGNWIRNLRSSGNKVFPATTYLNYGESSFPYYVPVREKKEKSIEILRDPCSSSRINSKLLKGNINKEIFDPNFSDNKSFNSSAVNFMKSITNTSSAFDLNSTLKNNSLMRGSYNIKGSENLLVKYFCFSYLIYI
jgi:hypothetical protein